MATSTRGATKIRELMLGGEKKIVSPAGRPPLLARSLSRAGRLLEGHYWFLESIVLLID